MNPDEREGLSITQNFGIPKQKINLIRELKKRLIQRNHITKEERF
jgi:hypothetical protein